jgi:hypothetical protein
MKRDDFVPQVMTRDEARYESYCDSIEIGISHETLCGFYGDINAERYQARLRGEKSALDRCWDRIEAIQANPEKGAARTSDMIRAIDALTDEMQQYYAAKGQR